jgi:hypothetical protein
MSFACCTTLLLLAITRCPTLPWRVAAALGGYMLFSRLMSGHIPLRAAVVATSTNVYQIVQFQQLQHVAITAA